MNGVIIAANTNIDWMKKFAQRTISTGNAKIDSLINAFGLKYNNYIRLTDFDGVYLETTHNYNIKSVNQLFLKIPGVKYSESFMVGKGNYTTTISDSIFSDHIELTYSYGWGDCPSGCINRHYWVFNIYDDAKVEFVRSYGKNIPIASIFDSFDNHSTLKIFPNPTSSIVTIRPQHGQDWKNIQIVNAVGKVVMEEKYTATIDLENSPTGVYTLRLYDQQGLQKQTKVVKK